MEPVILTGRRPVGWKWVRIRFPDSGSKRHHLTVMPFCWWGKVDSIARIALQCGMVNTSF